MPLENILVMDRLVEFKIPTDVQEMSEVYKSLNST